MFSSPRHCHRTDHHFRETPEILLHRLPREKFFGILLIQLPLERLLLLWNRDGKTLNYLRVLPTNEMFKSVVPAVRKKGILEKGRYNNF